MAIVVIGKIGLWLLIAASYAAVGILLLIVAIFSGAAKTSRGSTYHGRWGRRV